jgi:alpha-tubulin suppressor-like RCC1 family protein
MGAGEVPADLGPVVAIATGPDYGLALRPDGTVVQWGTTFAKHVEPPAGLADVVAVDAGSKFAVALRSDGSVVAWGFDWREKLVPGGLPPGTAISCGETQAHLLHPDGSVSYFGFPSEANASPWKAPPAFAAIRMLDDGKEAVVGLKADGSLTFLGNNKENQITGVPAKLKKSSLIACGSSVCAALSGDMLYFWGRGTGAKTAEYGRGSAKFAAIQINAAPFSSLIAARNAEGEWRFFGSSDSTDLHDAARRARGALDVKFSRDHFLALVHDARK